MSLSIFCRLPVDRYGIGDLILLEDGREIAPRMPCLGKADNERARDKGNPSRDPCLPYGDTPTGAYAPAKLVQVTAQPRLGRWFLPLSGTAGDALLARQNGRTGLGIHGGRGDRLVPTYGCIRLRDRDMALLAQHIIGRGVVVEVGELTD